MRLELQSHSALQCHQIPAEGSLPLLMDSQGAGFHLCWARPQQASQGAEASGGLQQQDGLSLYPGDGKEGAKMN